jgi:predicted small metal-binding protein
MLHINLLDMVKAQSPRRFAYPPLHLFWGGSEQNQRKFYYKFLLLRRELSLRPEKELPGLTTKEWRSILGDTYWKSMWPKPDANDPSPTPSFDHTKFWIYGGPLFFGDIRTLTITDYGADPTELLCCRCEVQMDSADDVEVRQTILYHLNMNHAVEEIREMDRLQFPLDHVKRWDHQG